MRETNRGTCSRRTFLGSAATMAFAFTVVPSRLLGKGAPSARLNLALIGVGGQGGLHHGSHGAGGCRIFPEEEMQAYLKSDRRAPKTLERVPKGKDGHRQDWIRACKGGKPASASFDYGGPLTELVLIGIIAMRLPGTKLQWDSTKMAFDKKDATALVTPEYRKGWAL